MDNFISILRDANSPEELEKYKVQLFKENVRLKTDRSEIEEMSDQLEVQHKKLKDEWGKIAKEREKIEKEEKEMKSEIAKERKKLETDIIFFNKKQIVLDRAFKQLDADRIKLDKEKQEFFKIREAIEKASESRPRRQLMYRQGLFFKGITTEEGLKKRYKDLVKVFHPDNVGGDKDTLQQITHEYETLKHDMGID